MTTDSQSSAESVGRHQTLWHGRFAGGPAEELMAFTVSLPFDQQLWREDIACSRAHVGGLVHGEILTGAEGDAIMRALDQVFQEFADQSFVFVASDEDIHTAVERRVTEICGAPGAKLHTGRSRNDQSVTGLRLWCKHRLPHIMERIVALQNVLLSRAQEAGTGPDAVYLPGYTHVQRAQPVLLAHHLLAHGWALERDLDRLHDAFRRVDVSPLGAGALAGSSLPLDPSYTARLMGFARPFDNSLDVVSDRDFVAEILFCLSMVAVHLSRLGEEWVLWTSDEFGFATLDDAYATGSSMLPQKKNADIAELARGKTGRIVGSLTGLLVTLKGLPLAYNRDLQEDKEPLFDSVHQVSLALSAVSGMIATAQFNTARMQEAADAPALGATDLAEFLVRGGLGFRDAHAIVGKLVRRSLNGEGSLVELATAEELLGDQAAALLAPGIGVTMRTTPGGAGPDPVTQQIQAFAASLDTWSVTVQSLFNDHKDG